MNAWEMPQRQRGPSVARVIVGLLVASAALAARAADSAPFRIEEALKLADERHSDLVGLRDRAAELQTRAAGTAKGPRARMLGALAAAAEARLEQRRVEVAAEVRASFARTLAARELVRETSEARTAFSKLAAAVESRRAKGTATELDVERSKLAMVRAGQEWSAADRRLAKASVPLLTALGVISTETLHIRGSLRGTSRNLGALDAAQAEALRKRADLLAMQRELEAARAARAGGDAKAEPSLATLDLDRAERAVNAMKENIKIEVAAAGERVHSAVASIAVFDVGLADLTQIHERVLAAYQNGTLSLEAAIGTLRDASDARAQYVLSLEELAVAEADFDRVLGRR